MFEMVLGSWRWADRLRLRIDVLIEDDAFWVRGVPAYTALLLLAPLGFAAVWAGIVVASGIALPSGLTPLLYVPCAWFAVSTWAAFFTSPPFEARIGDGLVTLERRFPFGIGPRRWQEPLTAYRGVRTRVDTWNGPAPLVDRNTQAGRILEISSTPQWVRNPDAAQRSAQGVAILEHATDPSRSIVLARRDDHAVERAFVENVATRLGMPVL